MATDRERLRQHVLEAHTSPDQPIQWNDMYKSATTPWDRGCPNPALSEILSRRDLVGEPTTVDPAMGKRRKRALVPGCGKGYDVLLLAAFGYDAYGLEMSELALEAARANEGKSKGEELYRTRDERVGSGKVTWIVGDFFTDEWFKTVDASFDGTFDLLYDYTFLSALPPSMRADWSRRFNQLLAPTGRLVCLEFPTFKPTSSGGPPWALPPLVYQAHLPRPGKTLEYDGQGAIVESELGEPLKDGLQRIAHFQPQKTHEVGYDAEGKVTDWVSVWAHPAAM